MDREVVRVTAGKVLRSDTLVGEERSIAASMLKDNPDIGNPHVVRCPWCRETLTLFCDESQPPFQRVPHGWTCSACDVRAVSQEVKV